MYWQGVAMQQSANMHRELGSVLKEVNGVRMNRQAELTAGVRWNRVA